MWEGEVCGKRNVFDRARACARACDALGGCSSLLVIHVVFHLSNLACDGGVKGCAVEGWRGVKGVKVNGTIPGSTPMTILLEATSRAAISIVRHNNNGFFPTRSLHCCA